MNEYVKKVDMDGPAIQLIRKFSKKRKFVNTLPIVLSEPFPDTNHIYRLIKKNPNDLVEYDSQGLLPIHIAIMNGNLRFVMMVYDMYPDCLSISTRDNKHTCLSLAVKSGRTEIARFLLMKFPNQAIIESEKGCPIHVAVLDRRNEIIKDIITYHPDSVRLPKSDGRYAIHLAATRTPLQVRLLLDFDRTLLDIQDSDGNFAQHFAAICGAVESLKEMFKYLENYEAIQRCLLAVNQTRCTPLYMASSSGHVEMVRFLLDMCPDSALVSAAKDTYPIHIACQQRHYEVVKILLERAPQSAKLYRSDRLLPLNMTVREISSPPSLDLLKLLIRAYPEAVENKNIEGLNVLQVLRKTKYTSPIVSKDSNLIAISSSSTVSSVQNGHQHTNSSSNGNNGSSSSGKTSSSSSSSSSNGSDIKSTRVLATTQIRYIVNTFPHLDERLYRELNWYFRKMPALLSYPDLPSQSDRRGDISIFARLRVANQDVWRHIILYL